MQVSNWFINARVRLWKPMIEEIHMLETKGTSGMDFTSANAKLMIPSADDGARPSMEPVFAADERSQEPWQGDKRSRVEESEMLMSFASYQHAMDIGGIDAVSLTLGLRHEGGQQNPHQMFHDFVGWSPFLCFDPWAAHARGTAVGKPRSSRRIRWSKRSASLRRLSSAIRVFVVLWWYLNCSI